MNENQIAEAVCKNCQDIVNNLKIIIKFYEEIGNIYYLDFLDLFNKISKVTEKEINNYFYNCLYNGANGSPRPKNEYHPPPSLRLSNNNNITSNNNNNNNNQNINNNINMNNNVNINNNEDPKKQAFHNMFLEYQKNKISPPFLNNKTDKKYTLVLDLDETLINIQYMNNGQTFTANFRPGLFCFLNAVKPLYELVSFTTGSKEYSESIVKIIETNKKYFDYNLYRDHLTIYGKGFVKDIKKLGRDINKIIIVDDEPANFRLNPENGIKIAPFFGDLPKNDTSLFELKKLLIMFHRNGCDDLRKAIKTFEKEIKIKISLDFSS